MELKKYLRVVASTGDEGDDYSLVEISNRRAREAADRIEKLEAALRKYADEEYNGYNADGAHARKALEGKKE
jgi:hypothetical protein